MSKHSNRDSSDSEENADGAGFISGIFNYCDRWCERCPMTARCRSFALQREFSDLAGKDLDTKNEEFWHQFMNKYVPPEPLGDERLEIDDISPEEMAEIAREEEERSAERHRDPLAVDSMAYIHQVNRWFERHAKQFKAVEKSLSAPPGRAAKIPVTKTQVKHATLCDAVSVIRWYQHQIHVKIVRALGRDEIDAMLEEESLPSDSDGSAKVALIGLDRSSAAWAVLRHEMPELADELVATLVRLHRLRRELERRFPKARAFVRPGFDGKSRPK